MKRLILATALTIAVLLLCGSPSRLQAYFADTKIVVGDGGSILLRLDGLDAGNTWKYGAGEVRHRNRKGVLDGLQITEAGADRCGGDPMCGVDPKRPWSIQVTYGSGWVTISSVSANNGVHLRHHNLAFDKWQRTANPDERAFGHGDGLHIGNITLNNGKSLCSGHGGCVITASFKPQ
ncbi:MAG: hypothetical protein ABSF98_21845 [Bryobacteraceae bacterium]|jgi:hypothetical protein